jgi:WD40 repeat protein
VGGKVAVAPDGQTAAGVNWFGTDLRLIDRKGRSLLPMIEDKECRVHGLAFAPDGRTLVTAGDDGRVRLWDTRTGRERIDLGAEPQRAGDATSLTLPARSPDGKTLAVLFDRAVQLCDPATGRTWRRLELGEGRLTCLAWSPDSRCLALGVEGVSVPNRILLWEPATGKLPRQFEQPEVVRFLAFAPDGGLLAAGFVDCSVHLWDPVTGAARQGLPGHDAAALAGAFAPDGRTLATGGADGTLRLWDLATRRQLRCWVAHGNYPVEAVAFAPEGNLLASVGYGLVRLWRADSGALVRALPGSQGSSPFVAFSPDGRRLVAPGDGSTFWVWETDGRRAHRVEGHQKPVRAAVWGPDGRTIVSTSADGTALVWDLGRLPSSPVGHDSDRDKLRHDSDRDPQPRRLGEAGFSCSSRNNPVVLSPDGTTAALVVWEGTEHTVSIREWPAGMERRRLGPFAFRVEELVYAPDGNILAVAGGQHVTLWDLRTGRHPRAGATTSESFQQFQGHPDQVSCLAFAPDGKTLAVGGGERVKGDYAIRLWDVASGQELRRLRGHQAAVEQLAFGRDGKTLFSFERQGPLYVWDLTTDRLERQIPIRAKVVQFSPDGRLLGCLDIRGDGMAIWDLKAGRVLSRLRDQADSWVFAPDGRTLATCDGKLLRLYRVDTGRELWEVGALVTPNRVVGFSPDGKTLVTRTSGEPNQLRFWDTARPQEKWPTAGHRGPVQALVFAPDGKRLLSGGADGSVRVWQVETGREVCRFGGHKTDGVFVVALSADGRLAASGDAAGALCLWDPANGRQLASLPDRVDRDDPPIHLLFAADGRHLLAAYKEGKIRILDVQTRKELEPEHLGRGGRRGVVSPDGRKLAAWGSAGQDDLSRTTVLRFCDRERRRQLLTLNGTPEVGIERAWFAPDGKTLALRENRYVSRWEPAEDRLCLIETVTGGEWLVLDAGEEVADLSFSLDGRFLAFRQEGRPRQKRGTAVWDLKRARRVAFLEGPSPPSSLAFAPDGKTLAVGCHDGTILLWAVAWADSVPQGPAGTAQQAEAAWADLAGPDAERARRAAWCLIDNPHQALPLLRQRVRPLLPPDPGRLAELLAGLNAEDFSVRERACRELEPLVEAVGGSLRQALTRQPSAELRRQVEHLLQRETLVSAHPERLRAYRAVVVLERIGTGEARQQLQRLAGGAAEAELTREAQAALRRLGP